MNPEHLLAQSIVRAWPFRYGAGRIIDRLFLKLKFENSVETIETSNGFAMTVNPNDLIGRHIYLSGAFDPALVDVLRVLSFPSDTLLDVGANIGFVSASFLNAVHDSSTISVEPQPSVVRLLSMNLKQFRRAKIYPYALGAKDEVVSFAIDAKNSGAGHISPNGKIVVPMRCPATMFKELNVSKVDLIKIDAEGFEETIVRSLLPYIQRLRPRAIVFEDNARSRAGAMLEGIDYKLFGLRKRLHKLSFVPTTSDSTRTFHDYVALLRDGHLPQLARQAFALV